MRIGDFVYFAPGLPFSKVNLSPGQLGPQWERRLEGFYLAPADSCAGQGFAFAAGLLVLSAIDAMARYQYHPKRGNAKRQVGTEFKRFAKEELPSFASDELADALYDAFRNGVVHEARVKAGAQFSLEQEPTVENFGLISVNPRGLVREVRAALRGYTAYVTADEEAYRGFLDALRRDFEEELRSAAGAPTT